MTNEADLQAVRNLVEAFATRANDELEERMQKWPVDLSQSEVHDVIGALLARQVTLASGLAECPGNWSGHFAPLFLRAMADVYIAVAWVLKDPADRSRKFIHYGLGREKLQLEHRKAELETRDLLEGEDQHIEAAENWINAQRLIFLTDVNLGSWSGLTTREMAQEANCLDFYNYVYAPFSACTHSMWNHIARYNLRQCQNPLHRLHSVPANLDAPIDPHYLYLASKYLRKTFAVFDSTTGVTSELESSFDLLCSHLEEFGRTSTADEA